MRACIKAENILQYYLVHIYALERYTSLRDVET